MVFGSVLRFKVQRGEGSFSHFQCRLFSEIITDPQQSCTSNHLLSPTPELALAVTLNYLWISELSLIRVTQSCK